MIKIKLGNWTLKKLCTHRMGQMFTLRELSIEHLFEQLNIWFWIWYRRVKQKTLNNLQSRQLFCLSLSPEAILYWQQIFFDFFFALQIGSFCLARDEMEILRMCLMQCPLLFEFRFSFSAYTNLHFITSMTNEKRCWPGKFLNLTMSSDKDK